MGRTQLSVVLVTFLTLQSSLLAAADVVTYDWRLTPIMTAFDGVLLETLGVNGKPCDEAIIEVELGQEVEVRVTNELYNETCLHWHGMKQLGTQEMDGPDKAGTFWWHSHHKTHNLCPCEKEIDQEFTVQLADVYHTAPTFGPALWDTIVINNRGRFNCTAAAINNLTECSDDQPLATYNFQAGKTMAPFDFSIDDHEFQVIAADGEPVEPTTPINSIFINAGQRYDIIVEAKNDTQDSFWMRAKGLTGLPWMARSADTGLPGFKDEGLAIVRYNAASTSEPTSKQCEDIITVHEFNFTPVTPAVLPTTPSDRSIVQFNITQLGGVISLDGGEYNSLQIPDQPPLLTISNGSTTADLPASANARALEYGKHIEVVVVNSMNEQHPFHLHSHAPWVVGSGQASEEDIYNNNLPPSKLEGAMMADNPGVWMMHCLIDWHMDIGLAMIFVEGEAELQAKGPDAFSSSLLSVCKVTRNELRDTR
ncbi:hypothetical protein PHYSODRAFT_320492 [Phytophthora sojae]|uniref:Multicopper oxidase n=1 Tax=Phytophthora sojae (strain P6497) TaxID=1094619 RepID=G4YHY5_PHYSP|nr:hypothetical protein PHYSODRAFT_320492 [Phytophthora sojae]EGZ26572.1 hypothetical protein PHYSODRAFT_320492 [Phytophthora sojae]|eukprot:XP_009513847.1 hypothetical protein PHYSODRAFT_320492 [Phytophthora sojae]